MKTLVIAGLPLLLAIACTSVKDSAGTAKPSETVTIDSTIYEITITDPGFEQWFNFNFSPAIDRTNDYYRSKNSIAVANWNDHYNRHRHSRIIDSFIVYNPSVDYGIEVNRKLYWYFRYLGERYQIQFQ